MRHCIACRHKLPDQPLFTLEGAPASAQNIPEASQVKEDQGMDLELYQCSFCGLVQFACDPVNYYRDVIRAGGFSTTMTELRRSQYRHLIEAYHLEGKKFLEVGCGRGEFIKVLTEFPVQVFGMEHKEELAETAGKDGLNVWQEFPETREQIFQNGPYDVFLSFNFLEHQPDPDVMLGAIWNNLTEGGMGLVTVPALEYILDHGSYYELIRDHLAYYSFGTLRGLLERNGFEVLEEEMINRDTISMIVRKTEKLGKECDRNQETVSLDVLVEGQKTVLAEMEHLAARLKQEGQTLALWGASHQGFTLAATTALRESACYIIDSAPFKQGRFAPASHLPIIGPDGYEAHPVDAVLIVAPGYTDEIAGIIRSRFRPGTEIYCMRTNQVERLN